MAPRARCNGARSNLVKFIPKKPPSWRALPPQSSPSNSIFPDQHFTDAAIKPQQTWIQPIFTTSARNVSAVSSVLSQSIRMALTGLPGV